jgi:two-component system sensor histidine kinase KdpD
MPAMIPHTLKLTPRPFRYRVLAYAVGACAATTGIAALLLRVFDLSNVVMVFLLTVVLVALRWGRAAGALAALLAVGSFDFFFVPPAWSFHVSDTQYVFTFFLMLVVALVIGQLAARLRDEAVTAAAREKHASALAAVATDLSVAVRNEDIAQACIARIGPLFDGHATLLLPGDDERMPSDGAGDMSIAQWVLEQGLPAGRDTEALPANDATYLPLSTAMRTRGVLMLELATKSPLDAGQVALLRAFQSLVALAVERVHYVEVAHETQLRMEGERLRSALLAAVSHDLRTPLTAIRGMAAMLGENEVARAIANQADRMQRQVVNLLDAARMQGEGVRLDLQWHALDEVVGSALAAVDLGGRRVVVDMPPQFPLVQLDAVLFERVLANLFDNAAKYTPDEAMLWIRADRTGARIHLTVEDDGPGFPSGINADSLFDAFSRGTRESAVPGVGLGLALSRRIVEAHGGSISASRGKPHGARFEIILAAGVPPAIELEDFA